MRLFVTLHSRVLAACAITQIGIAGVHAQALDELQATAEVCRSGPDARMARATRLAGAAQLTASSVSPNPALVIEHDRALTSPADHETVLGVSVPLDFSGRRSLLRDAASARGEQAAAEAEATLLESALAFRETYAAAVLDAARVTVLTRQQAVFDELSTVLEGLTKGGEAAEYDLLRQRMQAQLHRRDVDAATARAAESLARLEAWRGTKVTLPEGSLSALAGGSAADAAPVDASAQHPTLRSLDAQARASALTLRAAERRWIPELELFAGYRTATAAGATGHGVSLALEVPLGLFDHGQGDAALARAEQERALATRESLHKHASARALALTARLERLQASEPQVAATAQQADGLETKARQLYAAGETTITELLEALGASEQARLAVIDLAADLATTRLQRMRALGSQLNTELDAACGVTSRRTP
jgi:outer membrane protein, heavy metal efflux system